MSYLVTVATYQQVTGDYTTDPVTVSARIEEAQDLLADALDRPLAHGERTETLYPTRDGYLWPKATPITDAGSYTVEGLGLRAVWPNGVDVLTDSLTGGVAVTYSGGWVERTANPSAANRLPRELERDIALAAFALGQQTPSTAIPAGARSVSLGDASISFGADGAPAPGAARVQWSRRTLGYRYRVIGAAACSR